jgi:hypothetical protein
MLAGHMLAFGNEASKISVVSGVYSLGNNIYDSSTFTNF